MAFDNKPKRTVGEALKTYKVRIFEGAQITYEEFPTREQWLERRKELEEDGFTITRYPNRYYRAMRDLTDV